MPRSRVRLALATAVGMIATGALSTAVVTPAQAATPPKIKVYITAQHVVRMATHMRPGVHKFGVRSAKPAGFQILRVHGDYSKAKLSHDIATGLSANDQSTPTALRAIKRFERHVTLIGGVPSAPGDRGVMWLNLTPGTYWAGDTQPSKLPARKILTLHVGGHQVAGTMPGGPRLRAIHEADWAKRPASIPHSGVVTFRNDSKDNHFIATSKMLKGKTIRDVRRWINKAAAGQDPGPPPFDFNAPGLSTGAVSPGHEMAMRYDLPRGRYVMFCFWPDAENGGMPHAFMGMYRILTLR